MPTFKTVVFRQLFKREMKKLPLDRPINLMRKKMDELGGQASVAVGSRIEPAVVGGVPAEWIVPANDDGQHLLLYLHGGGYSIGSCESHRGMASQIAKACGARVLLPEYRLAPEHPYPAGLEDATAVYAHLLKQGYSPDNLAIAGDSAGGGLTLATLQNLREKNIPMPACAATISAWTDLLGTGHSMQTRARHDPWFNPEGVVKAAKVYYADADPTDPKVSPIFADYSQFPPLLFQVGDYEILLNDTTRAAQKAKEQGVDVTLKIWDGMWHVWHAFYDNIIEGHQGIEELGEFVRSQWHKVSSEKLTAVGELR